MDISNQETSSDGIRLGWRPEGKARLVAIVGLSAGTALMMMDGQIASIGLPTIVRQLHVPASTASLVVALHQLVLAMTILPFAALGDRVGHRRVYRSGMACYALAACLCLFADSLPVLLAIRAIQALSAAACMGVVIALVRATYPPSMLGRGLGINTLFATIGGALAPAVGGVILDHAHWQWIFSGLVPLAVISLVCGRNLPEQEHSHPDFDFVGAGLCAATFGLLISGLQSIIHDVDPALAVGVTGAGILVGIVFVRHQLHRRHPVLPVDLLAQRAFSLAAGASLCLIVGTSAFMYSMPFQLAAAGFSPSETGLMIVPSAIASILIGPSAAMLTDKVSPKYLSLAGIAVALLALMLMAGLPAHPSFLGVAWRMGLCGAGFVLFASPNARMIITSAPHHRTASAGGMVTTTRMIGQATGATVLGALLGGGLGTGAVPALVAAAMVGIAGLLVAVRPNVRREM